MHNNATTAQCIARRAYILIKEHNKANNPVRVPLKHSQFRIAKGNLYLLEFHNGTPMELIQSFVVVY